MSESPVISTVGHSNHELGRFLDLLRGADIGVVADVRSKPYCRYAKHFNKDAIERALKENGFAYVFLGGLLGGKPDGPDYAGLSGRDLYDRIAGSEGFARGLSRLLKGLGLGYRIVLMCGEEDPERCHRRHLLARALRDRGIRVVHIRGDGSLVADDALAGQDAKRPTLFESSEIVT